MRSSYSSKGLLKERGAVEQRINLISEYPFQQMKKSKTYVSVPIELWQLWMTQKTPTKPSQLNCSITSRLLGHAFRVTSAVRGSLLHLTAEDLDRSVTYEKQLPLAPLRKVLAELFEDSMPKLLSEVRVDKLRHSLHVPGLPREDIELLRTEKCSSKKASSSDLNEGRLVQPASLREHRA